MEDHVFVKNLLRKIKLKYHIGIKYLINIECSFKNECSVKTNFPGC